jgi:hypothetical protein
MKTLTQRVVGLSPRHSQGKDLSFTRQSLFANADPQRLVGLDRNLAPYVNVTSQRTDRGSLSIQIEIRQSPFVNSSFSLPPAPERYQGLNSLLEHCARPNIMTPAKPTSYVKNGILVHHAGSPITSDDIAKALAEE